MNYSENASRELAPSASSTLVHVNSEELEIAGIDLSGARRAVAEIAAHATREFTPGYAESLRPEQLLDLLDHLRGFSAGFAALEARTLDALVEAVRRDGEEEGHDEKVSDGIASREVSMASRIAPASATHRVRTARRLVHDMPETLDALAHAVIDPEKARAISRSAAPLDPAQRRLVDRALGSRMPDLAGAGQEQVCREVEALAQAIDPDGKERRHQQAKRGRGVTYRHKPHGMGSLTLTLTALDATLARKRLSLEAERLRASGDRRGHSAIMADAAANALIGREGGIEPATFDVGVIITDRALLDPEGADPAVIEGYGTVPPEQLRSELREALREPGPGQDDPYGPDGPAVRATLRRLYTNPTSGELVATESRSRAFPAGLAKMIRWRSVTCAGPYCNAQIRQSDHIRPRSKGGPTSFANGNGLCARCNAKEQQRLAAIADATARRRGIHRVRWTSRYGSVTEVVPTPLDPSALLGPLSARHHPRSATHRRDRSSLQPRPLSQRSGNSTPWRRAAPRPLQKRSRATSAHRQPTPESGTGSGSRDGPATSLTPLPRAQRRAGPRRILARGRTRGEVAHEAAPRPFPPVTRRSEERAGQGHRPGCEPIAQG